MAPGVDASEPDDDSNFPYARTTQEPHGLVAPQRRRAVESMAQFENMGRFFVTFFPSHTYQCIFSRDK